MQSNTGGLTILIIAVGLLAGFIALASFVSNRYNLNIKSRTVGDGQHGVRP